MIGFNEKNGVLHAENVPLTEIAAQYGSPTYVYSAGHIRSQYEKLRGTMEKILPADRQPLLCYACKANSNLAILKLLQSLGSSIEVVSQGELRRALKAGFNPEKIVFEGVGKTKDDIRLGLENNIHQFNIESLAEIELIDQIAGEMNKTANIVLRLNANIGRAAFDKTSTGRKGDKFGLSPDGVLEGFELCKKMKNLKAIGLFTHMGSQISQVEYFKPLFEKIAEFTQELRDKGFTISRLDIGGGFPIQYKDENLLDLETYAQWVNDIIVPLNTEIIMEPGRFFVGNSGILLTEVLYTKKSYDQNFLIVDAAMNDLLRPALYDAWHDIEPVENRNAPQTIYNVAGSACESGDVFAKSRNLPEINPGDLMAIKSAGAYGFCMASNYNTRLLPAEILVDGDKIALIRARQNYDEILDADKIPDWL